MSAKSAAFLTVLTDGMGGEMPTLTTLCRHSLELFPASGASVVLMSRGNAQGLAGASDSKAGAVRDLEFTLGEGPGVDAFLAGAPVQTDDLRVADGRWPQFRAMALGLGVRAAVAVPLQLGAINLGVLVFYRDDPEPISAQNLKNGLVIAELITHLVVAMQSETASESVAWALEESDYRIIVHQATGMISAQLDCGVEEALVRLRGRAFATERSIDEVARDVVEGIVSFDAA